MTVTETPEAPVQAAPTVAETAVAREVTTLWPNLFGPGVFVPLKIGIDKALKLDAERRGSKLSRDKIRLFVGWHVRRTAYHQAVVQGGPRHSVKGAAENARVITPAELAFAENKLQAAQAHANELAGALEDAAQGMEWWNSLESSERTKWMKAAGDTGVAADAWAAFKAALSTLR